MKSPLIGCFCAGMLIGCVDLEGYSGAPEKAAAPDPAACGVECAPPADPSPTPPATAPPVAAAPPAQVVLASNEKSPRSLVVAGDRLYWISAGDKHVRAMPKHGGGITVDINAGNTTPSYTPSSLYVDGSRLYWSELYTASGGLGDTTLGRIRSDNLTGTSPGATRDVHPKGATLALPIAGDDDSLYTCSTPNGGYYEDLEVLKLAKNAAPAPTSLGGFGAPATRLAADASSIYGIAGTRMTLAPRLGSGNARSYTLDAPAAALVAHGGFAYVTLPSVGTIRRVDPSSAVPTSIEVAAGQDEPRELAADASSLYWVNDATHELVALSLSPGAAPRTVAHVDGTVASIAVDDEAVYIATAATIVRITK